MSKTGENGLGSGSADEQASSESILDQEIGLGLEEMDSPASGVLLSGLSGGLDIGFGPLFMAVLLTLVGGNWGPALTQLLVANAYAVGFIFVIGARSALFTEHTTLAILPVLDGQATLRDLGRLWTLVYVGNILGGIIFSALAVYFAPAYGIVERAAFAEIASGFVQHEPTMLLAGGVIAGWLMGLLSWLLAAAQESISRLFLVWLVTTGIGVAHLPHSIAGNIEVLLGVLVSPSITLANYAGFLALATVGNAIGGTVFVGLIKYATVARSGEWPEMSE